MKDTSRILDLKYKLMTIELLNLAKKRYTYRELSQMVHLPETVLSRYVKGHVLPTADRAEEINRTLQKYMSLERELQERIKFDDLGYFDNTAIINDTMLLERAVQHAESQRGSNRDLRTHRCGPRLETTLRRVQYRSSRTLHRSSQERSKGNTRIDLHIRTNLLSRALDRYREAFSSPSS